MSLHQFLSIMRARRGLAGLILLGVVALALAWVLPRPARYVARAPVLVDVRTDPVGATPLEGMVSPTYIATQIDIVKSNRVAQRVVELLPADQEPMLRLRAQASETASPEQWLVNAIQRSLDVKPARESNIINISWSGRSPAEAARVANAFAQAYFDTNLSLKTAPAKRYTQWFDEQVQRARERLEQAQTRLSEFQQKAGIVSSNEEGDYETQRLAELSAQLLAAQGRGGGGSGETSTQVMQSPIVNNLRGEVAKLESKIQEAAAVLGANHPRMQQMEAELGALRARLGAETQRAGQAAAASDQVSAKRIRELQDQIAAQKARVLATGRQRGDLHVLRQEVESAQKAYDTVAASAAQSRLQGMTTQANVVFLGSATEPMEPSGPTPLQAVAVALGGGLLLGVAGALLAEFANRRVRSVDDLETVTQVPILGVVPAPKYRVAPLGPAKRPRRPAPIPLAEPGMGSQVYPLPTRAGTGLDQGPPGDLDFSLANRAPPPPMGRMLVESGRLVPEDVQLIREYATRGGLGFGEAGIALGLLGEDDVRQVLATQFGQAGLPPDSGLAPELIAVTHPYSDAVEQLRALRSQLLLRWFEKQGREAALAVVSPGAGEGRSWMAANLAVLFSQLGKRTILIDADLRHPRQHHMFGVPASVGLCAILAGRAGWETVTEVKALPGLSLLPAGALPPNPQELLARPGFARLIAALHSSYEVILVDTPAADSCADAGLIAARAGAVLMLACRDRSSVPRLAALSAELRQFGVTIVGAALNGAPERGRRH